MTNEPTTGELIEQLHTFDNVDAVTITIAKAALLFIADRIESQEQTIAALTARAEQAERERDAAEERHQLEINAIIADLVPTRGCEVCKHAGEAETYCKENECSCGSKFKWRGLPQEGEG